MIFRKSLRYARFAILSVSLCVCGQNSDRDALYRQFDQAIGKKNLGINNGTVHINEFKPDGKTNRYLIDKYTVGSVFYDEQWYPDYDLKYDLYQDVIIAKVDGQNAMGINLITGKTPYFVLDGKKFINLGLVSSKPGFASGYFEQLNFGDRLELYIKHSKNLVQIINTEGKRNKFQESEKFILHYNENWYVVDSQNSIQELFPDRQTQIADYYDKNNKIRNSDPKQFMRDLIKSLQN